MLPLPTPAITVELSRVFAPAPEPARNPPLPATEWATFVSLPIADSESDLVPPPAIRTLDPSDAVVVVLALALVMTTPIASSPPMVTPVEYATWLVVLPARTETLATGSRT